MKKNMKVWLFATLFTILTLSLCGFVTLNNIECIFNEVPQKAALKDGMVKGSAFFLQSFSTSNQLLKIYEESETGVFDKDKAISLAKEVIETLNLAKTYYSNAKKIGEEIGYSPEKITRFSSFNYDAYIAQWNLNPDVANAVKGFLEKNDVLGIYQQNIDNIGEIVIEMNGLVSDLDTVDAQPKPNVERYWKVLQLFCENALFGNYSTMLGTEVLSHCER